MVKWKYEKSGVLHMQMNDELNHINDQKNCDSFHEMIEFIGKRWTGVIIYRLLDGPKRYHELSTEIDGISDRLLIERLRELESHGIVSKNVLDPTSRKVEYELTKVGKELEDVIVSILKWIKANGCPTDLQK